MKLITNSIYDELLRAAAAARDKHPQNHNRKRDQAYNSALISGLNTQEGEEIRPEELQEGDVLLYAKTNNYGTRKYPYYLRVVYQQELTQDVMENHRTKAGLVWHGLYKGDGTRIYFREVLAVVR